MAEMNLKEWAARMGDAARHLAILRELDITPDDLDDVHDVPEGHDCAAAGCCDPGVHVLTDDATDAQRAAVAWMVQRVSDLGEDTVRDEIDLPGHVFASDYTARVTGYRSLDGSDDWNIEGVEHLLAGGGPTVWLVVGDRTSRLEGSWWMDSEVAELDDDAHAEAVHLLEQAREIAEAGA